MSSAQAAWVTLLVLMAVFSIFLLLIKTLNSVIKHKDGTMITAIIVALVVITVLASIPLSLYSWPFPISIKTEEVARVTATQDISRPYEESWYCVYDVQYFGSEELSESSYCGIPTCPIVGEYPPMDFDRYTYLFSFEREVTEITYYVWDNKGPGIVDLGTATKWGTAKISDEVNKGIIYIYRLPKMAIDNIHVTKYE